jgi:hypothetical protein
MNLKSLRAAEERERGYLMQVKDFSFAQMPEMPETGSYTLQELGMLGSSIENIDRSIFEFLKEDLDLGTITSDGFKKTPILWQSAERAYQIKYNKDLRDSGGALKLPLISIERTNITKDPENKGAFQAQIYSPEGNGRTGRMVVARQIVQDKTRNFAVASSMRMQPAAVTHQKHYPRINKKVVIRSLSIPIPIYINLDYKIVIKSEYQQQMNQLTAPFVCRTGQINSLVLKRNGHSYEIFIQPEFSQKNNVSDLGEDMRLFQTEINIKVLGYLIGDGENDDRPIVKVRENAVEVSFPREQALLPGAPGLLMD